MWHIWDDGLGQGNQPSVDPRELERVARIMGAALSTVSPGGVYVPLPFNLPSGAVAIAKRAHVGPSAGLDPWRDVVVLLNPDGSPGEAYHWPVVMNADSFIAPGYASGFPVRDFYCGFYQGECDHLVRAEKRLGPNPCWGKPSGTCDPAQYAERPDTTQDYSSLLTRPGLTRGGSGTREALPPVSTRPSTAQPRIVESVTRALGLPETVEIAGYKVSPAILAVAIATGWWLLSKRR